METVDAVLDAVIRILRREGVAAVTTNRIAEIAGVSIGSVYQYFPNKRAIFAALHDRHVDQAGQLIELTLEQHRESPFEERVRAVVEAMVEAHNGAPELHELLSAEVSHGTKNDGAFEMRLLAALEFALSARSSDPSATGDVERVFFILPHMIEAVSHGAALRRPSRVSLMAAKEEATRAVLAYLRA